MCAWIVQVGLPDIIPHGATYNLEPDGSNDLGERVSHFKISCNPFISRLDTLRTYATDYKNLPSFFSGPSAVHVTIPTSENYVASVGREADLKPNVIVL